MAEKEPIKVERLVAVGEARVPREAVYAATRVHEANAGGKSTSNSRCEIVPHVELVRDAEPKLKVSLKIWAGVQLGSFPATVDATIDTRQSECSSPTLLKVTVISTKEYTVRTMTQFFSKADPRSITVQKSSIEEREFRTGDNKIRMFNVPLVSVLSFLVRLEVYALFEVPLFTLNHTLNQARLRGDQHCDILLCADGGELPAHRTVLTSRSEVFAKMFESPWKETQDGRIQFKDTPLAALELFLEFVYTNGIKVWKGLELELLDLAECYAMDDLKEECRLRLWLVTAPRALQLMQSNNPLVADLKERFARIVMDNWDKISTTSAWRELQEDHPLAAMLLQGFLRKIVVSKTPAP